LPSDSRWRYLQVSPRTTPRLDPRGVEVAMRKTWLLIALIGLACALSGTALAKADGAAVYSRCLGCHTAAGAGIPGTFPPLDGHAAELVKADRAYPAKVVLYGLAGEIEVGGKKYNGEMPAFADQLKDEEVAAVMNYILSRWGNEKVLPKGHKEFTAAEVKALRGKKLSGKQVLEARPKLK
jgi:mono/diheme cytochrome c family protein